MLNNKGTSKDWKCKYCLWLGKPECSDECRDENELNYPDYKQVNADIIPLEDEKVLRILW